MLFNSGGCNASQPASLGGLILKMAATLAPLVLAIAAPPTPLVCQGSHIPACVSNQALLLLTYPRRPLVVPEQSVRATWLKRLQLHVLH